MADTLKVTFTRPVRVDKKRYAKGDSATIPADIAAQLMELVPPAAAAVEEPKTGDKKA